MKTSQPARTLREIIEQFHVRSLPHSFLGLRIAFELPAGVAANWVFRATLHPRAHQSISAAIGAPGRVILSFLVPVVLAPAFISRALNGTLAWPLSTRSTYLRYRYV